jgi:hypothetical protein
VVSSKYDVPSEVRINVKTADPCGDVSEDLLGSRRNINLYTSVSKTFGKMHNIKHTVSISADHSAIIKL